MMPNIIAYLADIGEIAWFRNDELLKGKVFVDPHWLCIEVIA